MAAGLLFQAFAGVHHQQCGFGVCSAGDHVLEEFHVARRIDHHIGARRRSESGCGKRQSSHPGHVPPGSYPAGTPIRALGRAWRKLPSAAPAFPHESAPVSCSRRPTSVDFPWSTWPTMTSFTGSVCGSDCRHNIASHHIYPSRRRRSKLSSASWSMARPARSDVLVVSSSWMIASSVSALLGTGDVMSWSPSER